MKSAYKKEHEKCFEIYTTLYIKLQFYIIIEH